MTRNISMIAAIKANIKQNTSKDISPLKTLGPHLSKRVCVPSQRLVQLVHQKTQAAPIPISHLLF